MTSNSWGETGSTAASVTWLNTELSMSCQCYVSATLLVILICFLDFCNFLNYDFFQNNKRYAFPKLCCSRLFSVDELIALSEEKKARYPEFDNNRFELANVYNCKFKANFILRTSAEVSWSSASPWKILLFSETKRRKPQWCTCERHLKDERKTDITYNLNRFAWLESLPICSTLFHHYSIQLKKENYFSRAMELDGWLSSRLKKTTKIL